MIDSCARRGEHISSRAPQSESDGPFLVAAVATCVLALLPPGAPVRADGRVPPDELRHMLTRMAEFGQRRYDCARSANGLERTSPQWVHRALAPQIARRRHEVGRPATATAAG